MARKQVTLSGAKVLDAQGAVNLVRKASAFSAQITLETGGRQVNAKSLMGVLTLGSERSRQILVYAVGSDEDEALKAVVAYLEA